MISGRGCAGRLPRPWLAHAPRRGNVCWRCCQRASEKASLVLADTYLALWSQSRDFSFLGGSVHKPQKLINMEPDSSETMLPLGSQTVRAGLISTGFLISTPAKPCTFTRREAHTRARLVMLHKNLMENRIHCLEDRYCCCLPAN